MKVVQFIYPMFLVALGMHALLLFVPIGGAVPEPIEEDVPFSDLTSDLPDEALGPDPSEALPVPDLNVSTASPDSAASAIAPSQIAGLAASVRPAAPAPRQSVARATARPTPPATRSDTATRTEDAASQPNTAIQPTPLLPDLSAADQDPAESAPDEPILESDPNEEAASLAASDGSARPANGSISGLIASARGKLPASLRQLAAAFSKALDYNPEGTDAASAEQELIDWQASIRRQANGDGVENIGPIQVADLTQISYPIESAEKDNGRPFSVCLEKAPHDAEIGVLFDPQGQIAGEPKLIRSTGYSALNEEIMATIASYEDFPADHQSKAYTFGVGVDYDADACVSLGKLLPSGQSSQ
ncbi:MAG: hypothetical protein ACR2FS_09770 [Phormidesmis sp.]